MASKDYSSINTQTLEEKEHASEIMRIVPGVLQHTESELSHVVVRLDQSNDDCDVKLIWCGLHVGTVSIFIGRDPSFLTFRENLTESLANKSLRSTNDKIRFSNGQVKSSSTMAMSSHGLLVTEDNWDQFRFSPVRLVRYSV